MQEEKTQRPMRILQVLPALDSGGVERGTLDLASFLKSTGHTPFIISQGGQLVVKLTQKNIKHIKLKLASKNPWTIFWNAFTLKKILQKHKIDLVHARSRAPAWSAYFASKMTKVPFVTTFHGTYNFSGPLKRWYNSVMARGIKVIAISPFIFDHIQAHYSKYITTDSIVLVNRGVDLQIFNPSAVTKNRLQVLKEAWDVHPHHKVILVPGRLTRWKGQLVVLRALQKLSQKQSDFLCVFIGSDQGRTAYTQELKNFVTESNLNNHVRFMDHVSDMPAAYALGHLVVHASTDPEAFGRVIIEAQAMGVPVIASNIGAPAQTIQEEETGFLHEAGNTQSLADVIDKVLYSDQTAVVQKALLDVTKNYSDALMFEKTVDVYKNLLNPKNILVIRHGAFGDIVKSLGAFKAIRDNHPDDEITLLTSPVFKEFCKKTGFFDHILEDPRERNLRSYFKITGQLYREKFDRVYDLQGSRRTGRYFKILKARQHLEWSGNVKGCPFHQPFSKKKELHPYERLADQLLIAGLDLNNQTSLLPDLSWLKIKITHKLPEKFFVMIPGSSPHTLEKRWPTLFYGKIALNLEKKGIETVLIGGADDQLIAKEIQQLCSSVLDLTGQTDFHDILGIAQHSLGIVGNDTGPLFLACASGKPTFVPWSDYCKAELNAPRGANVHLLKEPVLENLSPERLWTEMKKSLP